MEQKKSLISNMEDLAEKAVSTGFAASRFLTPAESRVISEYFTRRRDIIGLSRAKAAELITSGRVQLDHQLCLQPAKEIKAGSLLSVRGLGRAKLLETGGVSKKGRLFARIGLYSR